jgi:hypothetical protein
MMLIDPSFDPEMRHGGRCRQTMLRKTGVWSIGQPGFLVVAAEAEQVE